MIDSNQKIVISEPITRVGLKGPTLTSYDLMERPPILSGNTYVCKPPHMPHSYYLTINNYTNNFGQILPYEIFVKSKNVEGLDLLDALMLVLSALFRNECSRTDGNPVFIIRLLKSVNSHQGPYYVPNAKKYNSLVAHFADLIEDHFTSIGLIRTQEIDPELLESRRQAEKTGMLRYAKQCANCGDVSVVQSENCERCLNCGTSKC